MDKLHANTNKIASQDASVTDPTQDNDEATQAEARTQQLRVSAIVDAEISLLHHLCRLIAESWREQQTAISKKESDSQASSTKVDDHE